MSDGAGGGHRAASPALARQPRARRARTRARRVARAPRRALRRLGRASCSPASASPSRSTCCAARAPEKAVTTHPETLRCVLRALKRAGAEPFVADSPGGLNGPAKVARAYKLSGLTDVCAAEGVQIVDVEDDRRRSTRPTAGCIRSFPVGRAFVDADAIVQVGVLKTHQLMRLTGGVKLTYGCIPGLAKAQLHVARPAPRGLRRHAARPAPRRAPALHDHRRHHRHGGPGARQRHAARARTRCSPRTTACALDAALADRTAHERRSVYTLAASERRGLVDLDDPYRLAGDPDRAATPGSSRSGRDLQELLPPSLHRVTRNLITARPRLVDPSACIALRRLRRDLRHRAITMVAAARVRRHALRALLRLHRGLPHGGHRQRRAAARAAVLARRLRTGRRRSTGAAAAA